ncbi:hypothetical protein G3N58_16155 [Paraburkholderia sp. Ac-20342]|uniref:hypothetical protein n=1 Tax=Paraburkholderia sp. Ac-20342 TaxID=2703889 RepID=UPI00197E463E|nr:hypothetical protein [Paraburkholderia sp. Ac-20342]MBN3848351.1 hypothetical protein [Paraburkholderia sp. Ac-20342]
MATKDMKLIELARRAHDEIGDAGAALARAGALFRVLRTVIGADGASMPDEMALIDIGMELCSVYSERAAGELSYFENIFAPEASHSWPQSTN